MAWYVAVALALLLSGGCRTAQQPADGKRAPQPVVDVREGFASYYANAFDGRRTASGVRFDNDAMMAAHPTYPFGTRVRVTNLANSRSVEVRIVDRGPARHARQRGVIVDVSRAAARRLGFIEQGRARVRIAVVP